MYKFVDYVVKNDWDRICNFLTVKWLILEGILANKTSSGEEKGSVGGFDQRVGWELWERLNNVDLVGF